jgi:RNA polymerase sigma-70 factor (ECF subfamily)
MAEPAGPAQPVPVEGVGAPPGPLPSPATSIEPLLASRGKFLAYVRRKVADPDAAEDVLQESLLRALRAAPRIRDTDALVPWFYRVLDNAVVDTYRRRAARERLAGALKNEPLAGLQPDDQAAICACLEELLPALKPEHADVIRALDLGEGDPRAFAETAGITPNNLKVRRHRARQALRRHLGLTCRTCAEHHCLDCTCR